MMPSLLRIVGSLKCAAVVLVLLSVAMAGATVYEAMHGTPAALAAFYKSWWFELLLWLLGINVLASMLARFPWSKHHVGFVITHASILLVLIGALVTKTWGIDGQVSIAEGQMVRQFIARGTEAVTLSEQNDDHALDLTGLIGGTRPVSAGLPELTATDLRLTVDAYVPDGRMATQVVDNGPPRPGLQVRLSGEGRASTEWVLAGEPGRAEVPVSLRTTDDAADIDRALAAPTTQPAQVKRIQAEVGGAMYEFPLEAAMAQAVPIGETGYTLRVLRYLPHALISEDRRMVNASNEPVNPTVEVELASPKGTVRRYAFARFPEFDTMHDADEPAADVKLTFLVPADENAAAIDLLAGPEGRIVARFKTDDGGRIARELAVGTPVETPWAGLEFTVLQRLDNARREPIVEPIDPPRISRTPAVQVTIHAGQTSRQVWLAKFQPRHVDIGGRHLDLTYGNLLMPLGFELELERFHIGKYPGTQQPRSFESHVTVVDANGTEQSAIISMNHPAAFGPYTLFQSSYQQSRGGPMISVLSVAWDPGQPIVFTGYITMLIGMLYVLGNRVRRKNGATPTDRTANEPTGRTETPPTTKPATRFGSATSAAVALGAMILSLATQPAQAQTAQAQTVLAQTVLAQTVQPQTMQSQATQPRSPHQQPALRTQNTSAVLPTGFDLQKLRALPAQHNGRWMPLDTVARDEVEKVTGTMEFREQDPVLMLLAWTFDPQTWIYQPLISIGSQELRDELALPADQTRFSYATLVRHETLLDLIDELRRRDPEAKMNPLESKVADINSKLIELQSIFANRVIRLVPHPTDRMGAWQPIELLRPDESREPTAVEQAWVNLRQAFLANNASAFANASKQLSAELAKLPRAHEVDAKTIAIELRYNAMEPYTLAWIIMAVGTLLAAVAVGVDRKWTDGVAIAVMLVGFGVLTYGLAMRWQIAGRIPAANMFESLLFLSWGAGAFAIVSLLLMKDKLVPLTASFIGALALFLADTLPLDHFVRPIPPVLLDTIWMSIHVPVIMVSYSVLALAMLIAHGQLFVMAAAPRRRALIDKLDRLHYWYIHVGTVLLGAGIATGSMWAASSWGRYWGWDPKEVWSLIAFVAYLVILHVRTDREQTPRWLYWVGLGLGGAVFAIITPLLAPLSTWKIIGLAGAAAASVLFVIARGQFSTAVKSAVAFWFIIMTYVGVNYVLGIGLHSYGFGTGAVVKYMMLMGGIDFAILTLLTAIYFARKVQTPPAAMPTPAK